MKKNNVDELLHNYSLKYRVDDSFDYHVHSKIKKKKFHRKIGYASVITMAVICILFAYYLFLPQTKVENGLEPRFVRKSVVKGEQYKKKEIPVIEDLYFASYDDTTFYIIEPMPSSEEEDSI